MEVKLHHHALPIAMVMIAMFVVSFAAFSQTSNGFKTATKALVSGGFVIEPQTNGLAKIEAAFSEPTGGEAAEMAGRRAQTMFNFK